MPADLGKGIKVLLSSVSCKFQELVKFLATQKLCDFGNWELFLETQPRASSYSPSIILQTIKKLAIIPLAQPGEFSCKQQKPQWVQ